MIFNQREELKKAEGIVLAKKILESGEIKTLIENFVGQVQDEWRKKGNYNVEFIFECEYSDFFSSSVTNKCNIEEFIYEHFKSDLLEYLLKYYVDENSKNEDEEQLWRDENANWILPTLLNEIGIYEEIVHRTINELSLLGYCIYHNENLYGNSSDYPKYHYSDKYFDDELLLHIIDSFEFMFVRPQQDDEKRYCTKCGKEMNDGYVIENGDEHYCSDVCLESEIKRDEFNELFDDGNGDSYWTSWDYKPEELLTYESMNKELIQRGILFQSDYILSLLKEEEGFIVSLRMRSSKKAIYWTSEELIVNPIQKVRLIEFLDILSKTFRNIKKINKINTK